MTPIAFDSETRTFLITLRSSFYCMCISEDGALWHLASGPCSTPPSLPLTGVDHYKSRPTPWDQQLLAYELPATGDVTYHESAIRVLFQQPARSLAAGEVFTETIRDLRPRYISHEISDSSEPALAAPPALRRPEAPSRFTLSILLRDTLYAFDLRLFYRVDPDNDILERWVEVQNHTDQEVSVERLDFASMALPAGTHALTTVHGTWAGEFQIDRQILPQGLFSLEQGGLNTGHAHNPFFQIHKPGEATEESGSVWFGALTFSGNWSLRFEHLPNGQVRIFGGYGTRDFGLKLAPGEAHCTPAFVMGCSSDGFGGASRRLHRFTKTHILPLSVCPERPVLYNSWEATFFDVTEAGQLALAQIAAKIGVELFCVDDGWFGSRADDTAGLGDWIPRAEAFPRGLRPLADAVRAMGMRFGLWVEPEMVNPNSDLYRAHPDWVLHYPGRPRSECRNQLILDLGRPEVVDYLVTRLDSLVSEVGVDFFKWDMNRYASEPGSVAGRSIWRKHVEGLYYIIDQLRLRHSNLDIQSCSGGGGRIDLGILARCDQVWTSDNTDALCRMAIQEGYSQTYPPAAMECWVTDETNYLTKRTLALETRFDLAMRGVLGIGTPLTRLSQSELERYTEFIRFYKKIRPIIHRGDLYRLASHLEKNASVWLTVGPDQASAIFSCVVRDPVIAGARGPYILHGLDPEKVYRISDVTGTVFEPTKGNQLMTLGLPALPARSGFGTQVITQTFLLEAW